MAVFDVDTVDIPAPSSLPEVEALIRSLYDPSATPEIVPKINNALQRLQTSPEGWNLANQLCTSTDEQVQFFAALTFTVKLNTDWQSISEQDAIVLLQTLVGWLLRVIRSETKSFIWRKLCVTLTIYFIRFPHVWPDCIKYLLCCIKGDTALRPEDAIAMTVPTADIVRSLSIKATEVLLFFSRSLVEEVGKLDFKNVKNLHYHEKLGQNTADAVKIMGHVLGSWRADIQGNDYPNLSEDEVTLVKEALGCFQSWVFYSQRAQMESQAEFPQLKLLTTYSLHWIQHPQIYDTAVTLSSEILSNYFKFYTEEDISYLAGLISSPWGLKTFSKTVSIEDDSYDADENTVFPQLVISFAEAILERLLKVPTDPTSSTIFEMLHHLLKIPGYPIAEEDVSCLCFEFWSAAIEFLTENDSSTPRKAEWWIAHCKQHVFQAIEAYWVKLKAPPPTTLITWSKDDKEKFSSFRKDVADLLETSYPLLHVELYERLVQHALHNLSQPELNWAQLEATLYCINSLSDSLTDEPPEYKYLELLLRSPLFTKLSEPEARPYVRTKIAGINLIGQYSSFFEENPVLLPDALNFLFSSLPTPKLTLQASKSINSLCSSCRDKLTAELPTFVQQYHVYTSTPSSDNTSRERVIGALGYIIQALPTESAKLLALEPVISSIFEEFRACQALIAQRRSEEAKAAIVTVLRSLVSLGKALQAPDDVPIVIGDGSKSESKDTCWESGQGLQIQLHIAEAINSFVQAFPHDREVVEVACSVFRTGFSELSPGLLVFPPRLVGEFLAACGARTSFFDTVIATSSAFICSHSRDGSDDIENEARNLTIQIVDMIPKLQGVEGDPDFSQNAMEFFKRLFQKYLNVLLALERTQLLQIFVLALDALVCKEPFPKKAAAHFWKDFIQMQFDMRDEDTEPGKAVKAIMIETGPAIAKNLISALGGGASRSELQFLTEVLKKFVKQLEAKKWLYDALFSNGDAFPSPKASQSDKNVFLNKIMTLRGGRETLQVVNEFWLKCRGMEFAYAS